MVFFLYTIFFLFILHIKTKFNPFPTSSNLGLANSKGTQIVISPDQSLMIVGFSDGTVKIFDLNVNQICTGPSNPNSQITDLIWLPSFGPVTLNAKNDVILWSTQCEITKKLNFNEQATGIRWNQIQDVNGTKIGIVAINFQDRIEQYNIETGDKILIYNMPDNETSLQMIYNPDGEDTVLLVATSNSKIRKFELNNGTEIDSFDVESPVKQMAKISVLTGNVVICIAENNKILRLDSSGEVLDRGLFAEANSLTVCHTTIQIVLAHPSTKSIGVYLYAGQPQQNLLSQFTAAQDIDCSYSYLVSVDQEGYIYVYTYEEFKSRIIAIIGGVFGGLVLLVVGVIVFIKLRAKWALQLSQQKYGGKKQAKYPRPNKKPQREQSSFQKLRIQNIQMTVGN